MKFSNITLANKSVINKNIHASILFLFSPVFCNCYLSVYCHPVNTIQQIESIGANNINLESQRSSSNILRNSDNIGKNNTIGKSWREFLEEHETTNNILQKTIKLFYTIGIVHSDSTIIQYYDYNIMEKLELIHCYVIHPLIRYIITLRHLLKLSSKWYFACAKIDYIGWIFNFALVYKPNFSLLKQYYIYDFIENITINIFDIKPLFLIIKFWLDSYFENFSFYDAITTNDNDKWTEYSPKIYMSLFIGFLTIEIPIKILNYGISFNIGVYLLNYVYNKFSNYSVRRK